MKKYSFLLSLSLFFIISLFFPSYSKALDKPIVGAIRWDCWYGPAKPAGESCDKILSPTVWHYRIPFFGKFISMGGGTYSVTFSALDKYSADVDRVVRQDMAYAKNAGLDFWTFGTHAEGSYYNTFFEKYLAISQPDDVNFVIESSPKLPRLDLGEQYNPRAFFDHPPRSNTPSEITASNAAIATTENYYFGTPNFAGTPSGIMKHVNYQKVLGGRPLVVVDFLSQAWVDIWNSNYPGGAKALITKFKQDAVAAGVGNPYIVLMDYYADKSSYRLKQYGFDAISAYAVTGGTTTGEPYTNLIAKSVGIWDWQKTFAVQVVPVVQAGWDVRPKIDNPPSFDQTPITEDTYKYFVNPTPQQFGTNLTGAINWINNNASNSLSRVIIISAWNDNNEGSWIEPTIYEGDARLEAIAKVLRGAYFNTTRIKGVDLNSDRKIDFNDLKIVIDNFDKPIDSIPLNADINASGRVDIYDYNLLIQKYGR